MLIRMLKEIDVQTWRMLWNSYQVLFDHKRAQRVSVGLVTGVMAIP